MILIADSGATKTDWRVIDDRGQILQAKTQGLHPVYQPYEEIRDEIHKKLLEQIDGSAINQIFYYGSGCSSDDRCDVIKQALLFSFPAAKVEVYDDLLAAARSLCGYEKGIACILGTGSNSCLYDGENIIEKIPALGFILGDEGSGAYLGKTLLSNYFRNKLPGELKVKMLDKFSMDRDVIIDRVYNDKRPSRFVAGFSKFIYDNVSHPYMHKMVHDSFDVFFKTNVLMYNDYKNYSVHFTGGVAFYFNSILRRVAGEYGVTVGNIIENPIAGLTLYYNRS